LALLPVVLDWAVLGIFSIFITVLALFFQRPPRMEHFLHKIPLIKQLQKLESD
jgi:hypothetical protein